ncbi:hypothetical protein EAF00_005199 [Botryotinia globosa]|nr:hypothetical protein EAF00_005199 [Botryotinia globosa]
MFCSDDVRFNINLPFGEASVVTLSLFFIVSDTPKPARVIFHGIILYISIIEFIAIICFVICMLLTCFSEGWNYVPVKVTRGNRTSRRLDSSLHNLYCCTDLAWGMYDVSQSFVERKIGLWSHDFHVLSGALSLIVVAVPFALDIDWISTSSGRRILLRDSIVHSCSAGFDDSRGHIICNSNILFEDLAVDSAFAETLIKSVAVYDSIVSQRKVVSTGATELRKIFTAERSKEVFRSYVAGSKKAYIIGIAMVGMMPLAVFGNKCYNWKETDDTKAARKGVSENQNNDFTERMEIWK